MTPPTSTTQCRDEGCGLDGHGEHVWRYGDRIRSCAYCNEIQTIQGKWKIRHEL